MATGRVLLVVTLLGTWRAACTDCPPPGTTPQLREVLVGRCLEFVTLHSPHVLCGQRTVNCTDVAEKFLEAFTFQPTCNVTNDRYDAFFATVTHDTTPDKQVFWEDVYGFVNKYSDDGRRLVSVADTLAGYLADGLRFCAQPDPPGMILGRNCAGYEDFATCPGSAEYVFWAEASRKFASKARGRINIMLNATSENAFQDKSFFATWELPNINASQTTHARIVLVHVPGHAVRTTCSSESVGRLQRRLEQKGIPHSCVENPKRTLLLLCMQVWEHEECTLARELPSSAPSPLPVPLLLSLLAVVVGSQSLAL